MKEWNNPFSSFNSFKVLLWRQHLEGCATEKFLPPVTTDFDLSGRCSFQCVWCNAHKIINNKVKDLPTKHWLKVSDFIAKWGAKSSCIAGGGEPLMHEGFNDIIKRQQKNNLESGVITNGVMIDYEHIWTMADTCRWVGFSMDASTTETYMKVKGIKNSKTFYKVIDNINNLANQIKQTNSVCEIGYKFLIHPFNAHEIYEAAKLAKSIGVNDFHSRPVGFDNVPKSHAEGMEGLNLDDLVKVVEEQIEKALELEDENFHVYGVRHKFNSNMKRKVNFEKCRAIPLLATFAADGKVYLCFDMRGKQDTILCSHYPNPKEILKIWGSKFHIKMIRNINPNECPRCTFGVYNEIVEKVIMKDGMCLNFP